MITGNKSVQSQLQPEFNRSTNLNYNKCLQVSFTIQTSEFKCSGQQFRVENKLQKYSTIDNVTDKDELHTLPTDVRLTCPNFMEKMGPTRPTNPEEVVDRSTRRRSPRSPPEHILLKKCMATTSLSILILSKTYPSIGILSPLNRHEKLFGSGVCFAEKLLILDPYLQYFSSI